MADGAEHTVQFYDGPAGLAHRVADFVAAGLAKDEAAIVIATAEHRMVIEGRLIALGTDLGAATAAGRYVPIDATEMLAKVLLDGQPDRGLFAEHVGGTVRRTQMSHPRIRAFGEMVGLLWSDGKHDAALTLEELWNELLGHHPFALMCGYPARRFAFGGTKLAKIVDAHSDVVRLTAAPAQLA